MPFVFLEYKVQTWLLFFNNMYNRLTMKEFSTYSHCTDAYMGFDIPKGKLTGPFNNEEQNSCFKLWITYVLEKWWVRGGGGWLPSNHFCFSKRALEVSVSTIKWAPSEVYTTIYSIKPYIPRDIMYNPCPYPFVLSKLSLPFQSPGNIVRHRPTQKSPSSLR